MAMIDDERFPVNKSKVLWRTVDEAKKYISENGYPWYIDFDHDLGFNQPTGYDFALWLVETDMDSDWWKERDDFLWDIHSQNPIGAQNINNLLENYAKVKFGE